MDEVFDVNIVLGMDDVPLVVPMDLNNIHYGKL